MTKEINIRRITELNLSSRPLKFVTCFQWANWTRNYYLNIGVEPDDPNEEQKIYEGFEKFVEDLKNKLGDRIYSGLRLPIPSFVDAELITI